MASFLSNLVNSLGEGTHKLNVNMDMIIKGAKRVKLNTSIVSVVLNIQTI